MSAAPLPLLRLSLRLLTPWSIQPACRTPWSSTRSSTEHHGCPYSEVIVNTTLSATKPSG
eukprot:scaffold567_cov384-Prasinococcus_capsulatus_cf.AAC.14